jgi:hypothetical protein
MTTTITITRVQVCYPCVNPIIGFHTVSLCSCFPLILSDYYRSNGPNQAETLNCPLPAFQQNDIIVGEFVRAAKNTLNRLSINISLNVIILKQKVGESYVKDPKLRSSYDIRIVVDEVGDF